MSGSLNLRPWRGPRKLCCVFKFLERPRDAAGFGLDGCEPGDVTHQCQWKTISHWPTALSFPSWHPNIAALRDRPRFTPCARPKCLQVRLVCTHTPATFFFFFESNHEGQLFCARALSLGFRMTLRRLSVTFCFALTPSRRLLVKVTRRNSSFALFESRARLLCSHVVQHCFPCDSLENSFSLQFSIAHPLLPRESWEFGRSGIFEQDPVSSGHGLLSQPRRVVRPARTLHGS